MSVCLFCLFYLFCLSVCWSCLTHSESTHTQGRIVREKMAKPVVAKWTQSQTDRQSGHHQGFRTLYFLCFFRKLKAQLLKYQLRLRLRLRKKSKTRLRLWLQSLILPCFVWKKVKKLANIHNIRTNPIKTHESINIFQLSDFNKEREAMILFNFVYRSLEWNAWLKHTISC